MDFKPEVTGEYPKSLKSLTTNANLPTDLATQDPDAKVKCQICSKTPSTSCDHVKTFQTNGEQQSCDQASFSTTNIPNDIKAVHSTEQGPRFTCTISGCEKSYLSKYKVTRHQKIEHSENPVRFTCTVCRKEFKTMSHLGRHSYTHTNEKPFKCATCGRSFTGRRTMQRHKTTHLEKASRKSFKCNLCRKTFNWKQNLKYHIRVKHENEKNYLCPHCGKKSASVQELERHVEARHSDFEKIYYCDKCEYKSHTKYNLEQHVRTNKHIAIPSATGSFANLTN
ncbi:zinc finger protein 708-like [Folsomia candida]|uniref:zinc finger protein 708-like n=1 Tax=Folsomia candida TaxID=158441 RepID=UPI001604CDF9|nr:zinc finger protein 708-like [Folsomia candida]